MIAITGKLRYNMITYVIAQTSRKKGERPMKKKTFAVIAIVVVLVILLIPIRMNLKDGGSVRYRSLVYEVTKIHQLAPDADGVKPYIDGFEVKILGMTVYRETNE